MAFGQSLSCRDQAAAPHRLLIAQKENLARRQYQDYNAEIGGRDISVREVVEIRA